MPDKRKAESGHSSNNVKISILEAKKERLFEIVQQLYNQSLQISDPIVKTQFLARVQSLDKTRTEFTETLDALNTAYLEEDPSDKPNYLPLDSFDELYCYIIYAASSLKQQQNNERTNSELMNQKLPPLQLVGFDGTPTKWPIFYENFKTIIHDNSRLCDAEKVQYLIGKLSDKALTVCSGILPTGNNYAIIWNSLVAKYQDTRVQASRYLDQLINFKPNQTIDTVIEQLCSAEAALKRLNLENLSDFMLTHITLSKLDKDLVNLFEQTHRHIEIPTFSDVTKFLNEQSKIQSLRLFDSSRTCFKNNSQNLYKNNHGIKSKSTHAYIASTHSEIENSSLRANASEVHDNAYPQRQYSCIVCNAQIHPLFKCQQFLQLEPRKRYDIVNKHKFCKNCLGFHDVKFCKSKNRCFFCRKIHHSLLHNNDFKRSVIEPTQQRNSLAEPSPSPPRPIVAVAMTDAPQRAPMPVKPSDTAPLAGRPAQLPPLSASPVASISNVNNDARGNSNGLAYTATNIAYDNRKDSIVLLPTASVHVYNRNNTRSKVRVFIDTGSMSHFITKACCERLNLVVTSVLSPVQGIGKTESSSLGFTTLKIHSRFDKTCLYTITARVIDTISDRLPNAFVDTGELSHFENLPLADDYFHTPGDIDCLLGSELFPAILGNDKVTSPNSSLVALETTLGYIVMGRADCTPVQSNLTHSRTQNADKNFFCSVENTQTLTELTERFWELENVPNKTHISPDDEACEQLFLSTYSRDDTGRYMIHLPFKHEPSELGNSYAIAKRRLFLLEKKLDANSELRSNYNATIQDYINKKYLTEVKDLKPDSECYYIPHRAIYRPEKSTSKTRIVVDASCKTTSAKSLNDLLYKGSNLQSHIFDLLINLRLFSIALTADIEKMYFQILLTPKQHSFQRILYRFDSDSEIRIFEFNRVSFGVTSSPYLAMRVVRQLAADTRSECPLAAFEAEHHMYMDDYVGSVDGIEKAEQIYHEMVSMFKAGGFNIVKWISNSSELMQKISLSHKNPQIVNFDDDPSFPANTKVVGMQWQPTTDYFQFQINAGNSDCTKRTILSVTARLFDPLGLIGPVIAFMKLLVQECWLSNLGWDDPVPQPIYDKWLQFHNELSNLELIKVPRHVGITLNSHITLIGFADSSEKCYGAAVYIRVSSNENSVGSVNLLASKSKVASLKKMPLARLELCAALLLANLIESVCEIIIQRSHISEIIAFSDSTVTLTWIHSPAYKFHTFVANRITEINAKLSASHWFHVKSQENSADILSRPVTPNSLINCKFWFHGPHWLTLPRAEWPVSPFQVNPTVNDLSESKTVSLVTDIPPAPSDLNTNLINDIADRVSSWTKLLRTIVYVLRFAKLIHKKGPITLTDLDFAEQYVLSYVQNKHFASDLNAIKNNKLCSKRIIKLNPFIDDSNLIRVGGRLAHSQLDYGQKHPILLPSKERITQLLVDYYHLINLHTGPALLIALLRQKFWILSARNLVRQRVHACNICFKLNPRFTNPQMGDLPKFRTSQAKAFVYTAVDYAGPFFITHIRRRGVKSQKAYICLFVCLTTKALHLELVSDLSTELFLSAFKRFICRRGPVAMIYSDGASTFLGAKRKLDEIYDLIQSTSFNNYMSEQLLSAHRIEFKRSPPYGPHFNGLCEINVRCVKTHFAKIVGAHILTYEEFSTVLVQIEGLLNSRPLVVLNSDPSDLSPLTPNHLLNVTPHKFLPAEDLTDVQDNRLSRFQLVSKLTHIFWRRWSQEYLTSLQQREKWNTPTNPVTLGSIVIIKDQNAHPMCWPMGVVESLYPGKDGIIRTVKVRTTSGTYIRPVVRICPLPTQ